MHEKYWWVAQMWTCRPDHRGSQMKQIKQPTIRCKSLKRSYQDHNHTCLIISSCCSRCATWIAFGIGKSTSVKSLIHRNSIESFDHEHGMDIFCDEIQMMMPRSPTAPQCHLHRWASGLWSRGYDRGTIISTAPLSLPPRSPRVSHIISFLSWRDLIRRIE